MVVCCRCNKTGRCKNCACVKAGKLCQNCLPDRLGHCLNTTAAARPTTTPISAAQPSLSQSLSQSQPGCSASPPPTIPAAPVQTIVPSTLQTSAAQNSSNSPINPHQLQNASLASPASAASWPLPPLQNANFIWGLKDGDFFYRDVCSAYEHVIHWKPNLFLPPFGATGKKLVHELAHLLQAYADSSSLECIAMKGIVVLQQLLLQKPSKTSKAADRTKHLQRCLDLWHSGDVDALLKEGQCIQKRLGPNHSSPNKPTLAQNFAMKMKQGNVQGALKSLSMSSVGGVLNLDDEIPTGTNNVKCTVRDILADKHLANTAPSSDILLPVDQQSETFNPIVFDSLNADLILKAALKTKGAAGLSGLDAFAWRRLCSSFKSASRDLFLPG